MSTSEIEAVNITMVGVCLISAALAAGLTQGLLSISALEMAVKTRSGTDEEKMQAKKVLPIITKHHLLVATLLLFNATANEALPLFLDQLVPPYLTIVLSVTLVLMFGEIIPTAVFTGPNQLKIAATLSTFVQILMILLYPVAYPISLILDYFLGKDDGMTVFSTTEIATMMNIQHEEGNKRGVQTLNKEEAMIVGGALKFRTVKVAEVMTKDVFMLQITQKLTIDVMSDIFRSGFSRLPIYERDRNDVIGLILVKDLILIDPEDEIPLRNVMRYLGRPIIAVWPDQNLGDVLKIFRSEQCHSAIVQGVVHPADKDPYYEMQGIITMEDIFEEILGEEILDETDQYTGSDLRESIKAPNRNIDWAQLRLINKDFASKNDPRLELSDDEIKVISAHLFTSIPQIKQVVGENLSDVIELVKKSQVMTLKHSNSPNSKNLSHPPHEYLYKKGKVSNACTLILSGKATVLAGKEDFQAEMGPWKLLGVDALTERKGLYLPDFSAYLSDDCDELRCLWITKPETNSEGGSQSNGLVTDREKVHKQKILKRTESKRNPTVDPFKYDQTLSGLTHRHGLLSPRRVLKAGTSVPLQQHSFNPMNDENQTRNQYSNSYSERKVENIIQITEHHPVVSLEDVTGNRFRSSSLGDISPNLLKELRSIDPAINRPVTNTNDGSMKDRIGSDIEIGLNDTASDSDVISNKSNRTPKWKLTENRKVDKVVDIRTPLLRGDNESTASD